MIPSFSCILKEIFLKERTAVYIYLMTNQRLFQLSNAMFLVDWLPCLYEIRDGSQSMFLDKKSKLIYLDFFYFTTFNIKLNEKYCYIN